MKPKKVALVHNWLTVRGGSENVLFELAKIFPEAPIYCLVYDKNKFPELKDRIVITSWLQHIPILRYKHEFFPPIRYLIWRFTKLSGFDLVITSSSSENKAVRTLGAMHVAYIHTPPHYYWRYFNEYIKNPGFGFLDPLARIFLKILNPLLKKLDYQSAQNPDFLLANSKNIQSQIKQYYKRESTVLYPPVNTEKFKLAESNKLDFYLAYGRHTVFKKIDLIIEAFNNNGLILKVAGTGPEHNSLRSIANKNIEFLGYVSESELAKLVNQAKACIFANEEDFGISWVECMSAGTPAICYGSGGALETVIDGQTGILFNEQSIASINEAIIKTESIHWDRKLIREYTSTFSASHFKKNLLCVISEITNKKVI